ncbi:MAG: HutD family protein [Synergistaceae bacterium]|jgi:hypothetical protein|nr:HutD family protein [Synergistaceae bacterium]
MIKCSIKKREDCEECGWAGGATREFFIYPESSACGARDFEVRVSSATVEVDKSVFSDFTGFVRHIAPLSGELRLVHGGRPEVVLREGGADTFDGGAETVSYGRCVDFNLIHSPSWDGALKTTAGDAGEVKLRNGFAGCYVSSGLAEVGVSGEGVKFSASLNEGDFFLLEAASAGAGEFSLIVRPFGASALAAIFSANLRDR